MSAFADSSAVVKLYADEADSEAVRAFDEPLVVSLLARIEVPSALWRKVRSEALPADDAALLLAEFEDDFHGTFASEPRFLVVPIRLEEAVVAARLVASHGLRSMDALQLASALATRETDGACATMLVFDERLRAAAAAEGFTLVPETAAPSA